MSVRNTKSAKKTGILTVDGIPYTLARSDVFYYLKFIDYDKELFKTESKLKAKPTMVFYTDDSVNKIILDYSTANETDKKYLSSFFANMNQTSTFSLTTGSYLDASELSANVSCSLIFDQYKEGKVFARVSSVTDQNPAIDVYLGDYFTGTPQLIKTGSLGSSPVTTKYALVSVNPKTERPLSSLGMIVGDVLEVVNSGAKNNQIKYQITDIETLNDQEVLQIKPVTVNTLPFLESLLGQTSLINLYVAGTTEQQPQLSGDLGCCYKDDIFIKNNTEYQCNIRKNFNFNSNFDCSFNEINQIIRNSSDNSVPEIIVTSGSNVSLTSDLKFNINIKRNLIKGLNNNFGLTTETKLELIPVNVNSNIFSDDTILLNINQTVSFIQTDLSSFGCFLRFSTNKEKFEPYIETYGFISKNGIGSSYLLTVSRRTPLKIYLFVETILNGVNKYYPSKYSIEINPFL